MSVIGNHWTAFGVHLPEARENLRFSYEGKSVPLNAAFTNNPKRFVTRWALVCHRCLYVLPQGYFGAGCCANPTKLLHDLDEPCVLCEDEAKRETR